VGILGCVVYKAVRTGRYETEQLSRLQSKHEAVVHANCGL